MKICVRCGKELQDNEQFCSLCGGNKFRAKVQEQPNNQAQPVRKSQPRQMQPQVSMPQQQIGMPQQQMNMQNQQQAMPQQQMPQQGKKFKSRAEKKAQMQQEIAMMKQMQQQNMANGVQGQQPQQQQRPMKHRQVPMQNQGQQTYNEFSDDDIYDMTVKDWIIVQLFLLIPIYNIIYVIKGIKDYNIPDYKRNFLKAYGIYYLSALVLSIIIALIMTLLGI